MPLSTFAHGESMNQKISTDTLSRIDKFFMDQHATSLDESRHRRAQRGLNVMVGADVKMSYCLQLALLTAINLGAKCFAGEVTAHASEDVWSAPCLVPLVCASTLGDAIIQLRGKALTCRGLPSSGRYIVLGDVIPGDGAVILTFDAWNIAVGPATAVTRMAERPYCPLAGIAAAALAVGEVFAEFAGISVTATRRPVHLSLWRPDLSIEHTESVGKPLVDLPLNIGAFGLGHLGQAYLWALAALPYSERGDAKILLCDDDIVEAANIETGALLTPASVTHLKTRVVADWLEARGFSTRLLERRVDKNFKRTNEEPTIALSGFDDNQPRQWLSESGFAAIFDSGLGGEAHNFDTIAFRGWPNPRAASEVWPLESSEIAASREARKRQHGTTNAAYGVLGADECGRLQLAGKSVAVPYVGAVAACVVLAEMLKAVNGGPTYSDLKLRLCSLDSSRPEGRLASTAASPFRGLPTQAAQVISY